MIELPEFLPRTMYQDLVEFAKTAEYCEEVNEVDNVAYPTICKALPERLVKVIGLKLSHIMGRPIKDITMFLRLSLEGTDAPHQAHTDHSMGRYSFMLYLTDAEHCEGGTSFVTHKQLQVASAFDEKALEAFEDTNELIAWEVSEICNMEPNKGCLFESDRFHRAEPVGGFGSGLRDGRLVFTCFFS